MLSAGTPLHRADRLGKELGLKNLFMKNDAVCFPTLSFKDRVVATALAQARAFGFEVVSCSSTGNLANAVAAQAAYYGFEACIFIPADLEPAKIVGTQVYGANLIRVSGNYDQVNRLCSQIADRYHWGFVNINLASLLFRGIEDRRLRNRRTAWLAPAGQYRGAHGRRLADHEDRKSVQ